MTPDMTLRDWFAGQAATMWSVDPSDVCRIEAGESPNHSKSARFCYAFADAMLVARVQMKCTCPVDTEAGIREHAAGCPMHLMGKIRDVKGPVKL